MKLSLVIAVLFSLVASRAFAQGMNYDPNIIVGSPIFYNFACKTAAGATAVAVAITQNEKEKAKKTAHAMGCYSYPQRSHPQLPPGIPR